MNKLPDKSTTSPYGEPEKPELKIDTHQLTLEQSVQRVISLLRDRNILPAAE